MRIGVLGAGAVGARTARQLGATDGVTQVLVGDRQPEAAAEVAAASEHGRVHSATLEAVLDAEVVVLALPTPHATTAEEVLRSGRSVVSVGDDWDDVTDLLSLDVLADDRGATLVVGAAFAPGLSCLLAAFASGSFDAVDEVHVAKHGTGGPACARQHHRALRGTSRTWQDGRWVERPAGAGRELCWFPEPVGPLDCYRADLPESLLIVRAWSNLERATARVSATRRDRLTARLPMLRPPHPEGLLGAIRVELRGDAGGGRESVVVGAVERPGIAAGAVAAVTAVAIGEGRLRPGAYGLADRSVPAEHLLVNLADRGIRPVRFVGAALTSNTW